MRKYLHYTSSAFSVASLVATLLFFSNSSFGQQTAKVTGFVKNLNIAGGPVTVTINSTLKTLTDSTGYFEIQNIPFGKALLEVYSGDERRYMKVLRISQSLEKVEIVLGDVSVIEMDEVIIRDQLHLNGLGKLGDTRGTAIFAGKKNDVLIMKNFDANLATNTARQVFSKIAGTNIWENDGSGIQLNVASRGLSPNRSWEYNMRQNEYDIAADILGYPDMYYSPPMEAISHIEVVRGSASLQYGTQLGGLLNFVLKKGTEKKPLELEMKQSVGAYGLFNSYNSIGGTKNKFSYFGYFHHRSADGWRNNSDYKWNTGFASVVYKASERLTISAEFTRMQFLLHLSAGLTDSMFNDNPRKSVRERNWFRVNWNIPSVKIGYKISPTSEISVITYMLLSSRKSVENTKTVNIIADTGYRDIRNDHYHNFGTEVRYLKHYSFSKHVTGILSGGIRYYKGRTSREQGLGTNGRDPNFSFLHPTRLEYSDYIFRNNNVALFAENVIKIGKLSVVPGIRFEYIKFIADGYFNSSGTLIYEKGISSSRRFPLFGVGFEYKLRPLIDIYANFTQGYRAANFNDIRITSPNLVIDPDLKDSHGNNFDLGIRGKWKSFLSFDVSVFYLAYNDRIGIVTRKRPDNTTYQISTNIASSRNIGLETFLELELMKAFKLVSKNRVFLYASYSNIDAQYIKSENDFLKNNTVEFVPQNILRTGLTFKSPVFSSTINYSSVSKQYSDANNTVASVTGNNGIVPGYNVIDWSSELTHGNYKLGLSLNNITNNKYFTRRSTSYPGPGLIPAEPVTFLVSLTMKL